MQFKIILVNSDYVLVEIKRGKRETACQKKAVGIQILLFIEFFLFKFISFQIQYTPLNRATG